jgi:hypothetical protein
VWITACEAHIELTKRDMAHLNATQMAGLSAVVPNLNSVRTTAKRWDTGLCKFLKSQERKTVPLSS